MVTLVVNKFTFRRQRPSTIAFIGTKTLIMADIILILLLEKEKEKDSPSDRLMSINAFCTQLFNK